MPAIASKLATVKQTSNERGCKWDLARGAEGFHPITLYKPICGSFCFNQRGNRVIHKQLLSWMADVSRRVKTKLLHTVLDRIRLTVRLITDVALSSHTVTCICAILFSATRGLTPDLLWKRAIDSSLHARQSICSMMEILSQRQSRYQKLSQLMH